MTTVILYDGSPNLGQGLFFEFQLACKLQKIPLIRKIRGVRKTELLNPKQ
jgi:hypothetical protein